MSEDKKKALEGDKKNTRLKKNSAAGAGTFSYKYTELADINAYLDERGESYYQYTEWDVAAEADYIFTVIIDRDNNESKPRRGVKIIAGGAGQNAAQQQGSGVTYARRYSLLMALGLATEDDDGANADSGVNKAPAPRGQWQQKRSGAAPGAVVPASEKQINFLAKLLKDLGRTEQEIDDAKKQARAESSKTVSAWIKSYQQKVKEQNVDVIPTEEEVNEFAQS